MRNGDWWRVHYFQVLGLANVFEGGFEVLATARTNFGSSLDFTIVRFERQ